MDDKHKGLDWVLFGLIALAFFAFVMHRVCGVMFITEDEFAKGAAALTFISRWGGAHPEYWAEPSVVPHLLPYPMLMFTNYIGCTAIYVTAAFIFCLGAKTGAFYALKLSVAAFGLLALLCIFVVVRRLAGRLAALLAVFFLATNNMFILAVRNAYIREEVFQIAAFWLGLVFVVAAAHGGRRWLSLAGLFVFGLALWAKIMFAGYALGALFGLCLLGGRGLRILRGLFFSSVPHALSCFLAFALGASPFIYYNVATGFPVFRRMFAGMTGKAVMLSDTMPVWDNADILTNLGVRFHDLWLYLGGAMFLTRSFSFVFPALFVCALVWAFCYARRAGKKDRRRELLIVLCSGYFLLLVLTCFVPVSHAVEHVLILIPFCELLCALFVARMCEKAAHGKGRAVVLACAAALWLLPQALPWIRYGDAMNVARGRAYLTETEKDMVMAELSERGARNIVATNIFGWTLKFFDPSLNVFIVQDVGAAMAEPGFCERFRDGREWWAVLSVFDFDRGFYDYLMGRGLFAEPENVIAFRDRDDCAVGFIKFNSEPESTTDRNGD